MSSREELVVDTAVAPGFVGVTAAGGRAEMVVRPDSNVFVKSAWLDDLPVSSDRLSERPANASDLDCEAEEAPCERTRVRIE